MTTWVAGDGAGRCPAPLTLVRFGAGRLPGGPFPSGLQLSLRVMTLAAVLLAAFVLGWGRTAPVGAHAALAEADPPVDGVLVAPPAEVVLRFTEAVDQGAGSPAIRVLNEAGDDVTASVAAVDPTDPLVVRVGLAPLGPGTYTVAWTARSAVDGHTLTGSHAFRYGGGRAPGAATTEGERPAAWAVATRWLTFLGMALVVGGFLVARVVIPASPGLGRLPLATAAGAVLGLVASLAEVWLPTRWPPAGVRAPTLAEAIAGVPDAAWVRVAGLAAAVVLVAVWAATPAIGRRLVALEWAGLGVGLVALLGLSMTSHAAARSDQWRALALGSNILHQWSVAAWVGGLVMVLVVPPAIVTATAGGPGGDETIRGRLRRFSAWALVLVIVATVTGVVNTGLVLPAVAELWGSTYGRVILIKVAVLTPALVLAGMHRTSLRRGVWRSVPRALAGLAGAMRATLRVETAIVAVVVLGGSTLSMLAPPAARSAAVGSIVIADPILDSAGEVSGLVRLEAAPLRPGPNRLVVSFAGPDGAPRPLAPGATVSLDLISLDEPGVERSRVETVPDGPASFAVETGALTVDGWWRAEALVRQRGVPDTTASFVFLLPDPNLHGAGAVEAPAGDPEAIALFERATAFLGGTQRLRYRQVIGGGDGSAVVSRYALAAGVDGAPAAMRIDGASTSVVKIGEEEWLRTGGTPWLARRGTAAISPAGMLADYEGATGFGLGRIETVAGREARVITFAVDQERYLPAWYAWWVDTATGEPLREAMVSRNHYMVNTFLDYDASFTIAPPLDGVGDLPAETPVDVPGGRPDPLPAPPALISEVAPSVAVAFSGHGLRTPRMPDDLEGGLLATPSHLTSLQKGIERSRTGSSDQLPTARSTMSGVVSGGDPMTHRLPGQPGSATLRNGDDP